MLPGTASQHPIILHLRLTKTEGPDGFSSNEGCGVRSIGLGRVRPLRRLIESLTDEAPHVSLRPLVSFELCLVSGRQTIDWTELAPELDQLASPLSNVGDLTLLLPKCVRGCVRLHESPLLWLPGLHTLRLGLADATVCLLRLLDIISVLPQLQNLALEGLPLWPQRAAMRIRDCYSLRSFRLVVGGTGPPESLVEVALPPMLQTGPPPRLAFHPFGKGGSGSQDLEVSAIRDWPQRSRNKRERETSADMDTDTVRNTDTNQDNLWVARRLMEMGLPHLILRWCERGKPSPTGTSGITINTVGVPPTHVVRIVLVCLEMHRLQNGSSFH